MVRSFAKQAIGGDLLLSTLPLRSREMPFVVLARAPDRLGLGARSGRDPMEEIRLELEAPVPAMMLALRAFSFMAVRRAV
jgi:hypothetical protein